VDSREARGQCPGGYTQSTIFMTVDYGSLWDDKVCNYVIVICYKCGVSGVNPHNFRVKTIHSADIGCDVPYEDSPIRDYFQQRLREELYQKYLSLCSYPPCPLTVEEEIIRIAGCWKINYNAYTGNFGVVACDYDNYCVTTQEVCMDYSLTPPQKLIVNQSTQRVGVQDCDQGVPFIPINPIHNWESDCFLWYSCP